MRKNLQAARKATGMTQRQVAEYLDISERYYRFIESGIRNGDLGFSRRPIPYPPKDSSESLCQLNHLKKHLICQPEQLKMKDSVL